MKTLAAYLLYWSGLVVLFVLILMVPWKKEKVRWWED